MNEYLLCTHCMPGTRLGTWHPGTFKEILNSHGEFVHYGEDLWLQGNESGFSLGTWREKFLFFFWYVMTWAADGRRRRRGNPGAGDDSSEVLRFLCLSANCRRQVELNRRRGLTPLERFWIALCDDTHKCAYLLLGTESKVEFLPPL